MESELGITGPQRLVLRVVGQFPGLSAGDLAHIVRLHPSTITGILQRLVAADCSSATAIRRQPRASVAAQTARVPHTRTSPRTVENAVTRALDRVGASNVRAARKVLTEVAQSS